MVDMDNKDSVDLEGMVVRFAFNRDSYKSYF